MSLFKNFRNTTNSKSWARLCKFMRSREARRRSHAELAPEDRFIKVAAGTYCWFITVTFWFTLLHARFPFIAATDDGKRLYRRWTLHMVLNCFFLISSIKLLLIPSSKNFTPRFSFLSQKLKLKSRLGLRPKLQSNITRGYIDLLPCKISGSYISK